jgi:protein-histidine pros-kinase
MNDSARSARDVSQLATVDLEGALARLLGKEDLLQDLVQFFCEDAPPLLEKVRRGIAADDAGLVEYAAHSLKGLATNFGAARSIEAARRLEEMAHDGEVDGFGSAADMLEQELALLAHALEPYRRK